MACPRSFFLMNIDGILPTQLASHKPSCIVGAYPCGRPDNYPQVQGERAEESRAVEVAKCMPATKQRKRSQPFQSVCQPGSPSLLRPRKPPSCATHLTNCLRFRCSTATPSCVATTCASSGST